MKQSLQASVFGALAGFASLSAYAVPVHIDAGSYSGNWRLDGIVQTGSANVDLAAGNHNVMIARYGSFNFNVAADGTVTSATPQAATGGNGALTFKTAKVIIDPQAYDGSYSFVYTYTPWFTGGKELVLITGLDYHFKVGLYDWAAFHLNEDGTATSLSPNSIDVQGSTVSFLNSTLMIDPADFTGKYSVWNVKHGLQGTNSLVLVPGLYYAIGISGAGTGFRLDATGNVVSIDKVAAASAVGNTLTFKTVPVVVDPGQFNGAYSFAGVSGNYYGLQTIKLMPQGSYAFTVGYGNNPYIAIDASGNVTPQNRPDVMTTQGNQVTLRNIDVDFTAAGANYSLHPDFAGAELIAAGETRRIALVPNLKYRVRVDAINGVKTNIEKAIEVQDPCAILPGSHEFASAAGSGTITFSCPALVVDADADGIPDESDNCPATANADQLDMDEDGQGNACDADLDGDTVANAFDNCPANSNADQADLDLDTLGDACDSDVDGDGVQDAADNCPFIGNAGQGNSDGDTQGDACDVDDDNDSVDDLYDNCPVSPNADQSDIDGDREGDMCDGDRDGDGVENAADQCPATPAGSIVTVNGCNGAQLIAKSCSAGDFKNHGQYVSCVTKAANEAVNLDLISNKEKSAFVTEAAQSK